MIRRVAVALGIVASQLALAATATAGDGTFGPHSDLQAGSGPSSAAIADFNSDGLADVAVANATDGDIAVMLGTGGGTFGPKTDFLAGGAANAVAVGDFNSDAREDVVVANRNVDAVSVLLGAGDGSFGAATSFGAGNGPVALAIGDFNADRVEDLAVANYDGSPTPSDGSVSVLLGAGNGSFGADTELAVSFPTPSVAVGDFDSDGFDDLVAANEYNGHSVSVLLNDGDGDGSFGAKVDFEVGIAPTGVAVGDFNSDGFEDVATANSFDGDVSVLIGAGNGSFGAKTDYPVGGSVSAIAVGDFDSDDAEDLAVATASAVVPGGGHVSVLPGTGDGAFAANTDFPVDGPPADVAVGDLDSDGNQDLAVGHSLGATVSLLFGEGSPYLGGNLLTNGGAEGATAARGVGAPQIPGWTRGPAGSMTYVRYPFRSAFSQLLDAGRWEGGLSAFSGGPDGPSSASQTVSVSDSAPSIDASLATAHLAADLGGFRILDHRMQVAAEFRDGAGTALGSLGVGPVTAAERHNVTELTRRRAQALVPPGTRSIEVDIAATTPGGILVYSDAYADNVRLTLDAPEPPPSGGDPPAGQPETPEDRAPDLDPPETSKNKGPKRKLKKPKTEFAFSSDEPGSTFECALNARKPRPCASPVKVKGLGAGRHKFTATAIDPAGNRDLTSAIWRFKVIDQR